MTVFPTPLPFLAIRWSVMIALFFFFQMNCAGSNRVPLPLLRILSASILSAGFINFFVSIATIKFHMKQLRKHIFGFY